MYLCNIHETWRHLTAVILVSKDDKVYSSRHILYTLKQLCSNCVSQQNHLIWYFLPTHKILRLSLQPFWRYDCGHQNWQAAQLLQMRASRQTAKFQNSHVTITMPLLWVICHPVARIYIAYLCTKFHNFRFSHSSDMIGAQKLFNGLHDLITPLSGTVYSPHAVTGTLNLYINIKFEVFAITNYEDA